MLCDDVRLYNHGHLYVYLLFDFKFLENKTYAHNLHNERILHSPTLKAPQKLMVKAVHQQCQIRFAMEYYELMMARGSISCEIRASEYAPIAITMSRTATSR